MPQRTQLQTPACAFAARLRGETRRSRVACERVDATGPDSVAAFDAIRRSLLNDCAITVDAGSLLPCGGAAPKKTSTYLSQANCDRLKQPEAAVDKGAAPKNLPVRNSMVTFPEADPRQGQAASCDAAGCTGGSGAQKAPFANPSLSPGSAPVYAAPPRSKAAARCGCSMKSTSSGRGAGQSGLVPPRRMQVQKAQTYFAPAAATFHQRSRFPGPDFQKHAVGRISNRPVAAP